jgi:DNA-binding transcriptional ArsR family regulator
LKGGSDFREIKSFNHLVDSFLACGIVFNQMVKSSAVRLDSIFHALSDSTRRSILRDVSAKGKTVGEIARPYAMSLAAVSKHLKVLEAAELIARERRGSFQIVRLNAKNLRPAEEWLAFYDKFWKQQLDALQSYLEEGEDDGDKRG